jgi:hypothetical protein
MHVSAGRDANNRTGWLAKLSSSCFSRSRRSTVLCWCGWRRHSPGLAYQTRQSGACWKPPSLHARIDDSSRDACERAAGELERSCRSVACPQQANRMVDLSISRCVVGLHISGGRPTRSKCTPSDGGCLAAERWARHGPHLPYQSRVVLTLSH